MDSTTIYQKQTMNSSESPLWVLDGGTGREIEALGGPFRQPEWSALALYEDPDIVRRVHSNFVAAGAQGIITNSYAIVPFHLGVDRYKQDRKRLLKLSIDLAHEASCCKECNTKGAAASPENRHAQVLGSIPPLCGSYEAEKFDPALAGPILKDFLEAYLPLPMGDGLPTPAVDTLLLETIGSITEAKFYLNEIILAQSSNSRSKIPVWLSFCIKAEYGFDQTPHLLTNETLTAAVQELHQDDLLSRANVQVIMVNCCDIRVVKDAIVELGNAIQKTTGSTSSIRLGAYPNAFSIPPPDAANHTLRQVDYNITPAIFQDYAKKWIDAGATVLGGCCGVGPQHIAKLHELASQS